MLLTLTIVLLWNCPALWCADDVGSPVPDESRLISKEALLRHVSFLGSDSLQGRGTGSEGEKLAARYLANILDQAGIEPFGDEGTFFQKIPMHGSIVDKGSGLLLSSSSALFQFIKQKDYLLYKH